MRPLLATASIRITIDGVSLGVFDRHECSAASLPARRSSTRRDPGRVGYLDSQGAEFYFSLQNIAEFWNVCTRPTEQNGYGLSIDETSRRVEVIERTMTLLPDNDQVYAC